MSGTANAVLFLRLEGPLQAWGDNSKFVIRRTMEAPTKSGVIGLISCAMGLSRSETSQEPIASTALRTIAERLLPERDVHSKKIDQSVLRLLNTLQMGVRIDRAGIRWWDYHTVGAKVGLLQAKGGIKRTGGSKGPIETLISRREYLCDANFLVALRGDLALIQKVADALANPKWPLFLGRKSCPPSIPILARPCANETWTNPAQHDSLRTALGSVPWRPRLNEIDKKPTQSKVLSLSEWQPHNGEIAPSEAEVWYDVPVSFDPPVHEARLLIRDTVSVEIGAATLQHTRPPSRPRADYKNVEFRKRRKDRLESDQGLCVFCKSPATTVQHITYRRAGGNEEPDDLRALCRLCHDAVTMIEYGLGMGLDRIDPCAARWRDKIMEKRDEIRRWRSEEGRRRALRKAPEDVRREVLEEEN